MIYPKHKWQNLQNKNLKIYIGCAVCKIEKTYKNSDEDCVKKDTSTIHRQGATTI